MRTYNSQATYAPLIPVKRPSSIAPITAATKTVSIKDASVAIQEHKGLTLSEETIRNYCRSGKWIEGVHWTKYGGRYLINLAAVYETIVSGH